MSIPRLRNLPIVALVGRANVGKSTLWNRLTETGSALVSPVAHTTRDRNYASVIWRAERFEVVDTGGLDAEQGNEIGRGILHQAELAIKEADLVLFLVDARAGVMGQDRDLAQRVRQLNKNIILVANKTDNNNVLASAFGEAAWKMGLGEPNPCSASTGRGVGDLLDRVYGKLHELGKPPQPLELVKGLRLVVMGRPNVGKSSIVNSILGEDRVIVSPIAHTTREPMDTELMWGDQPVTLVDTAGMRRRSRIEKGLEEDALEKNREALLRADVAFLVIDATEEPSAQDKYLAGLLKDETKGLALIVNKWDLVEDKKTDTSKKFEAAVRSSFPFLNWAPIIFVSAKQNLRTQKLLDLAFQIREERRRTITYNALQKFLKTMISKNKPLAEAGTMSPYIHDIAQIGVEPPSFLITIRGQRAVLHTNWIKFFEKRLREKFGFDGTPILIKAQNTELKYEELPDDKKRRVNRRKRPIGRRTGGKQRFG
jgi:GTP-binding protein